MKSKIIYFLRKALKLDLFESAARETSDFKFLTVEFIAELEGISKKQARKKLSDAVRDGFLIKRYLFTETDLDLNILVDENQVGKTIDLSDLSPEFEAQTIFVSPQFSKEVYIAS